MTLTLYVVATISWAALTAVGLGVYLWPKKINIPEDLN